MRAWGKVGGVEVEFEIPKEYQECFRSSDFSVRQDNPLLCPRRPGDRAVWCPCEPKDRICTWPSC